jgi:hypothetical protein
MERICVLWGDNPGGDCIKRDLAILIFLSFAVRLYLYLTLGTILGSDVGRFAIITHAWFLKGQITPNLQPYDMATGFFYFPGALLLMWFFENFGIDSISTVTFFSFLLSFIGTLVFYKIARLFLNEREAIGAYFFYSFLFDFVFTFNFYGIFTSGVAWFFFLIAMWQSLEFILKKNGNYLLLISSMVLAVLCHGYSVLDIIAFSLAVLIWDFVEHGKFDVAIELYKKYAVATLVGIIVYAPFFMSFGSYFPLARYPENTSDLFAFSAGREALNIIDQIRIIFFTSYVGTIESPILYVAFALTVYSIPQFLKDKKALIIFLFIVTAVFSFCIFDELNLLRITALLWIPYALVMGKYFNNMKYNALLLVLLFLVPSPGILYSINAVYNHPDRFIPLIDFQPFNKAMGWIRGNTPLNSTFIMDGGGAGCTGASASYGERIFPLTSRKIFYFTDYCFADYNRSEYEKRVDIYRRISINPDDEGALNQLHLYNVTYVFIGKWKVGFDYPYFARSQNYELVYNDSGINIFKVR